MGKTAETLVWCARERKWPLSLHWMQIYFCWQFWLANSVEMILNHEILNKAKHNGLFWSTQSKKKAKIRTTRLQTTDKTELQIQTRNTNKKKDPQKKHHLGTVSKKITGGLYHISWYWARKGEYKELANLKVKFKLTTLIHLFWMVSPNIDLLGVISCIFKDAPVCYQRKTLTRYEM